LHGSWGIERFTTSEPLRQDSSNTLSTLWSVSSRARHRTRSRAWAFSSHGARCFRTSDTPVASPSSPLVSRTFVRAASFEIPLATFWVRVRVPRVKESPRPLSTTLRKKAPLPSIRDVFHRQVPFVGSGGRLQRARWPSLSLRNPGPATVTPLLATCRPMNDALAPLWAWYRTAPFHRLTDPIRGHSFRTTRAPTFHRRFPRRLGPRSLDPAALFGARVPSLFEARCRLPTSATTCLRCAGTNQNDSRSSLGRRP
jgi:hypothetical protein